MWNIPDRILFVLLMTSADPAKVSDSRQECFIFQIPPSDSCGCVSALVLSGTTKRPQRLATLLDRRIEGLGVWGKGRPIAIIIF